MIFCGSVIFLIICAAHRQFCDFEISYISSLKQVFYNKMTPTSVHMCFALALAALKAV
jgi:hypothetical protein